MGTLGAVAFGSRYLGLIDEGCAGNGIATADPGSDFLCESFAVRSSLSIGSFGRIGEEAAFHEHCRDVGFSQYVVTTSAHSTIGRGRASNDKPMNG